MNHTTLTLAVLAAAVTLAGVPAHAQDKAPAKAAPAKAAPAAGAGAELYPKAHFDLLLKERMAQGQPDTPELRNAIRENLNTRELLVREAKKKGLDKNTDVKSQMDLSAQAVLVNAYLQDWVKANPVPEATLRKEYDAIKSQMGDKEYKVRHILVEKEDEAKEIIAALQKGEKFEKLAERSKDPGSKANGGNLDWNAPGNFVKPFSDAMVKVPTGKFTTQPVQSQFGWHVIAVDEVRDAKVPPFEEVKPQLQQRVQNQQVEQYIKELRAKSGG
jgi:peptidyl-prolyl cis-trans isomerase C